MRRIWPRTLLGGNLLLLTGLIVLAQLCAVGIFIGFIQDPRIENAASMEVTQILLLRRLLAAMPEAPRRAEMLALDGIPDGAMRLPPLSPPRLANYWLRRFFARMKAELPADVEVRWDGERKPHRLWVRLPESLAPGERFSWIALQTTPMENDLFMTTVLCLLLTQAVFPVLGAWLIHRRIDGPLKRLASATASIEHGVWPDAVPVAGPAELSTVTVAFNRMTAALAELESTRAEMLAGISHDIRTPLTKLRMAIAAPESFDAPTASAERFVEDIDAIVQQFIDYARGHDTEAAVGCDLNAVIEELAADYAGLGKEFALQLSPLPPLTLRPVGMLRLAMNLMQNAARYGGAPLSVRTAVEHGIVLLAVEDRGPGVPAAILAQLKQPFRRGSHGDGKGGTGLGLAIADRIARQHGGTLELVLRAGGGLSAQLRLPCPRPLRAPPR
jgi:two-component system osmolarity sensor histidine kinase EnvZ